MTQKEQMLRYIKGYDVVAEVALQNQFGSSFQATLKELYTEKLVSQKTEYRNIAMIAGRVPVLVPDSWHITPEGEAWLKDMDDKYRKERVEDRWARSLAIAALLISLIAILK